MRNVADIKREENLNFILPMNYGLDSEFQVDGISAVVVIHLYYKDTVDFYLNYVRNIPKDIEIIFTTSDPEVVAIIDERVCTWRKKYRIILKENRGRDISSFLVSCREEILKHEYCCFLHDRKEKNRVFLEDTVKLIRCMWENAVGSETYIQNILRTFALNPRIGVLTPPVPLTPRSTVLYDNIWYDDFDYAVKLAKKLGLHCNLDRQKAPITIGTTFWARTEALKKLLRLEWRYEDFDPEPLPGDGTLSHAIERIFAYVAQDAEYETGWVMTDGYAGREFEYMQETLQKAFISLREYAGISTVTELDTFDSISLELVQFCQKHKKIYIYGKGYYGKKCLLRLRFLQKEIQAVLVTDPKGVVEFNGIPVYEISEEYLNEESGVIVAVSLDKQDEVLEIIQRKNPCFANLYRYDGVWRDK